MTRVASFVSWAVTAVGAAYVAGAFAARDWLLARGASDPMTLGIIAVTMVFVLKTAEHVVKWLIASSRLLRRILLGRTDIEGVWIDYSIEPKSRRLLSVELVTFEYVGGHMRFGGEVFTCAGESVGNFDAVHTGYEELRLWYVYTRRVNWDGHENATGTGELSFTRSTSRPTSYTGSYFDVQTEVEVAVVGSRVLDRGRLAQVQSASQRASVVREAVAEFLGARPAWSAASEWPSRADDRLERRAADGIALPGEQRDELRS